jgi:hypothetical protein
VQQYLSAACEIYSQSRGGEEMKAKMIRGVPDYGEAVSFRNMSTSKKLCHDCDMKPVLAAKTD